MADPVVNTTTTAATTQYPDWWKNYSEGLINTATQIASHCLTKLALGSSGLQKRTLLIGSKTAHDVSKLT